MTDDTRPIAEEELHAYVDGRLAAERRRAIERYLDRHPEIAARVAAYEAQRQGLRQAFGGKGAEPIPAELDLVRLVEARLSRPSGLRRLAAAILVSLALGGAAGWTAKELAGSPASGIVALTNEAVAAHSVFVPDRQRPIEIRAPERDRLQQWLSARLGRPVVAPDLTALGYRFMGGRLVSAPAGPAALLMYDDDAGTRLTLYLRVMPRDERLPMSFAERDRIAAYAWADHHLGFAVTATTGSEALQRTAQMIRRQLGAPS